MEDVFGHRPGYSFVPDPAEEVQLRRELGPECPDKTIRAFFSHARLEAVVKITIEGWSDFDPHSWRENRPEGAEGKTRQGQLVCPGRDSVEVCRADGCRDSAGICHVR